MIFRNRNNINKDKPEFSFTQDERDGTMRRFTLKGQVGINESAIMEHKPNNAIELSCTHAIINMSMVSMFSSAGIRVILAAQ
jgi:hypothetical protein